MKFDIFISHDVDDKEEFTNELVAKLKLNGFSVWYSGIDLLPGDDLSKQITKAMDNSRFGIPVISQRYLESYWGIQELSYMSCREKKDGRRILIPIWHGVNYEDVQRKLPLEANRFAIRSTDNVDHVVSKINKTINAQIKNEKRKSWFSGIATFLIMFFLLRLFSFIFKTEKREIGENRKPLRKVPRIIPSPHQVLEKR